MTGFLRLVALAALAASSGQSCAQAYPSKPVRLIIDFPAGGPSDSLARVVGQKLTESLGQTVVFDNRPGANGVIAYSLAAKAPADGCTLVIPARRFAERGAAEAHLRHAGEFFADLAGRQLPQSAGCAVRRCGNCRLCKIKSRT
jgi:hypothetical protein